MEIAVVGLGYWGPNIVRNSLENSNISKVHVYDADPARVNFIQRRYQNVIPAKSYTDILLNDNIEAVAIITPVTTHYSLIKNALEAGKNVIAEKPFTATVAEAEELVNLASQRAKVLLVDHTFLYTSAVRKMKELLNEDELGQVFYYDSVRVNLGKFQKDVNVVWDLAPHDFSIMDFLLEKQPVTVSAMGSVHINGLEDVAYIFLKFDNGLCAHFHVNWMSPVKVRKVLIGASKKMLEYDELEPDAKVRVYDKGVDVTHKEEVYKALVQYRSGDMYAPKIENSEALGTMIQHFVDCVENRQKPLTDGEAGLRVVQLLEASQKSIKRNGQPVKLCA